MCGIAGVFGRRDEALVRRMLARLHHRGPDDEHVRSGAGWTLGATRLSIVDVDGGRQPLANESGRVVACQNGEIYDHVELRAELERRGHLFATRSDTEVLVHGLEEWGRELPRRLVGMFAAAVWDDDAGEGLLVRDRVGKKPLYWHEAPDGAIAFASEIKALLELESVRREVDPVALDLYLGLKHVPGPRTIFRDVRELPPSHAMRWRPGQPPRIERYARVDWSRRAGSLAGAELDEALVEAMTRAVRRRMRSDVPIGFFLSGGVDSSLVAALGATLAGQPIHTYTLTYGPGSTTPGKDLDRRCARLVAERYGTLHVEEEVDEGDLSRDLPAILACFDQPFAGVFSTFHLARRIAADVKVALSGDGADELFGSYLSHRLAALLERPTGDPRAYAVTTELLARAQDQPPARWRAGLGPFSAAERASLYTGAFSDRLAAAGRDDLENYWHGLFAATTAPDLLDRVLETEFASQLPDQVLQFVDRLSMAHSLEVRCPFLDQDLVALIASAPPEEKIDPAGNIKASLRRVARRWLPAEVIDRPKEGFLMPVNAWLTGQLGPWVRRALAPEALSRAGVFRPEAVAALLGRLERGDAAAGPKVLALVAHQLWHDLYLEDGGRGAVSAAAPGHRGPRTVA